MKKIISIVLALAMIFTLGICAFAEGETGTITVENANKGKPYYAYKIFDVQTATVEGTTSYAYGILGDADTNPWYPVIKAYADQASKGLNLDAINDGDYYMVTIDETKFDAADFAYYLMQNTAGKDVTATRLTYDEATQTASATGLELGYYFVTSSAGALAALNTAAPDVTIDEKNDIPFNKVADKVNVEIGETVTFTVTGVVPDTTGNDSYIYTITDTMTEGLTWVADEDAFEVTVGTTTLERGTDYTVTPYTDGESGDEGFVLNILVRDLQDNAGEDITVTYSAVVNGNAIAKVETNTATLAYGRQAEPNYITKEASVYSDQIIIDKFDKQDPDEKLEGASFVLYKMDGDTKLYYAYDAENEVVSWVAANDPAITVKTTDTTGKAAFIGLKDGVYYVEETVAPAGYAKLNAAVESAELALISADCESLDDYRALIPDLIDDNSPLTVEVAVENAKAGGLLPSTGGIGTVIFYVVGAVLVLGAAILLVVKRRMRTQDIEA